MADKSFGVDQLDILGTGTPTISAPNQLNLDAHTVAISTSVTVGEGMSAVNISATGISTIAQPANSNPMANWTITNKNEYLGSNRINDQLSGQSHKVLKKFTIDSRKIARTETVGIAGETKGIVTSGNFSPVLNKSIGFILFENMPSHDLIEFDIRGNLIEGNIVNKRFLS